MKCCKAAHVILDFEVNGLATYTTRAVLGRIFPVFYGRVGKMGGLRISSIRKKPGKKLTDAEKASNKAHSRIRVYVEHAIRKVKTWRIMGDRYRNPLKKYDRINDVVCGLVNQRLLWLAERAA